MSVKILLTGATGYLGNHLVQRLTKNELLCTYHTTKNSAVQDMPNVTMVSVNQPDFIKTVCAFAPDMVIHAAGVYDKLSFATIIEGNLVFPLKLMEALANTNMQRWINIGTALPRTTSPYSLSKHQLGDWGYYFAKKYGFVFVNVLMEQFYGPNDGRFLSFVVNKLMNDKPLDLTTCEQRRDLIQVDDAADGVFFLSQCDLKGSIDVPMGFGDAPILKDVVLFCKDKIGSQSQINFGAVPMRENEPMLCEADISMIKSLGYVPKTKWQDGLSAMIGEMKK